MADTVTAVIDMAHGGDFAEDAAHVESLYGVRLQVSIWVGPGGGWPEVSMTGERAHVERALRDAWGMEPDDIAEVVT